MDQQTGSNMAAAGKEKGSDLSRSSSLRSSATASIVATFGTAKEGSGNQQGTDGAKTALPKMSTSEIAAIIVNRSIKQDAALQLSVEVEDAAPKDGEGRARRNYMTAKGNFITTYSDDVHTMHDSFAKSVSQYSQNNFLGRRPIVNGVAGPYEWTTYQQVATRVYNLASGLLSRGIPVNANIGIYSVNIPEWLIAEKACFATSLVTVPLYDTLGEDAIRFICVQAEIATMFASSDRAKVLLKYAKDLPMLKCIILMDHDEELMRQANAELPLEMISIADLEKIGSSRVFEPRPPKGTDLCTICYTSGTTGAPKGVMLTHGSVLSEVSSGAAICGVGSPASSGMNDFFHVGPDDVHISYLPLAHIFERVMSFLISCSGGSIGFYQGHTDKLIEDIAELRPTIFASVPRLLNRVYDKIRAGIRQKGPVSRFLFEHAYDIKLNALRTRGQITNWLYDRLVFSKVRARLGGRVRVIITGSAPISSEVFEFLRICFSCEVYEGYGQTETNAASAVTIRNDWTTGAIGVPFPSCEIKLVDIPDMNYTSQDKPYPRGEVCIRGPCCFSGYYKDPEKTRETIDEDGWVHTGDIGAWDANGRLKIIDRRKNLFKLSQGEYVSPEHVEIMLCKNEYFSQAFVHGNSLENAAVAVVVPDEKALTDWAKQRGLGETSLAQLCGNHEVKNFYLDLMKGMGNAGTRVLKGFEVPREVFLEPNPFSVENQLLTVTFKLKRFEAQKMYSKQIAEMYANLHKEAARVSALTV